MSNFYYVKRTLPFQLEVTLSDISTLIPSPSSTILQGSSVFVVPFDPKIPLFAFLIPLGINIHRILTEDPLSPPSTRQSQENNLVLQNDEFCGLPDTTYENCEFDCNINLGNDEVYSDPTCLGDCVQYPACFQQLYKDYETAGTVGINANNLLVY